MIETAQACPETVGLLWAMIFGAADACIRVSFWSILQLLLPFAVAIMVVQAIVNRVIHSSGDGAASSPKRRGYRLKSGQRFSEHRREAAGE